MREEETLSPSDPELGVEDDLLDFLLSPSDPADLMPEPAVETEHGDSQSPREGHKRLSGWGASLAGGGAGALSSAFFHPLSVVQTRFQGRQASEEERERGEG